MSQKRFDDSWTVGSTFGRLRHNGGAQWTWMGGNVVTPDGYVEVYSDEDVTSYSFVHSGREYRRTERRSRTERGATIMAAKFAKEIMEAHP